MDDANTLGSDPGVSIAIALVAGLAFWFAFSESLDRITQHRERLARIATGSAEAVATIHVEWEREKLDRTQAIRANKPSTDDATLPPDLWAFSENGYRDEWARDDVRSAMLSLYRKCKDWNVVRTQFAAVTLEDAA